MARIILACLIFLGALIYLVGIGWMLFGGAPPEWLATMTSLLGAALATNFGAVLGIDLANTPKGTKPSRRVVHFIRKISGFDKDKLPEMAAGLYFIVLLVGFFVQIVNWSPAGLAHDLFFGLLGAGVAAFTHVLKK